MSGNTWLLSTAAVLSANVQPVEATTTYTKETRADVRAELAAGMKADCNTTKNTYMGLVEAYHAQSNSNAGNDTRESTAATMKDDRKTADNISTQLDFSRVEIPYKRDYLYDGAIGEYRPAENMINLDKNFVSANQKEIRDYNVSAEQWSTAHHEIKHQTNRHETITTPEGEEICVLDAPMSLVQHYKVLQADEISANIAAVLSIREIYIDRKQQANNAYNQAKALCENTQDKELQKLKELFEKGALNRPETTKKGKIIIPYKTEYGADKKIDITNHPELISYLNTYYKQNDVASKILAQGAETVNEAYFSALQKGKFNPLNNTAQREKEEMAFLAQTTTQKWMKHTANDYAQRHTKGTLNYIGGSFAQKYNYLKLQDNEQNFQAAMKKITTVGGYDFSANVIYQMNRSYEELHKQIADEKQGGGKPKEEEDRLKYYKQVLAKNNEFSNADSKTIAKTLRGSSNSEKLADYIISSAVLQGKEDLSETLGVKPAIWTKNNVTDFSNQNKLLQQELPFYPEEKQAQINQLMGELNLDKLKAGDKLTFEQVQKLHMLDKITSAAHTQYEQKYFDQSLTREEYEAERKRNPNDHPWSYEELHAQKLERYVDKVGFTVDFSSLSKQVANSAFSDETKKEWKRLAEEAGLQDIKTDEVANYVTSTLAEKGYRNPLVKQENDDKYGNKDVVADGKIIALDFTQPILRNRILEKERNEALARVNANKEQPAPMAEKQPDLAKQKKSSNTLSPDVVAAYKATNGR